MPIRMQLQITTDSQRSVHTSNREIAAQEIWARWKTNGLSELKFVQNTHRPSIQQTRANRSSCFCPFHPIGMTGLLCPNFLPVLAFRLLNDPRRVHTVILEKLHTSVGYSKFI